MCVDNWHKPRCVKESTMGLLCIATQRALRSSIVLLVSISRHCMVCTIFCSSKKTLNHELLASASKSASRLSLHISSLTSLLGSMDRQEINTPLQKQTPKKKTYVSAWRRQNFRRFSISVMYFGCTPYESKSVASGGRSMFSSFSRGRTTTPFMKTPLRMR